MTDAEFKNRSRRHLAELLIARGDAAAELLHRTADDIDVVSADPDVFSDTDGCDAANAIEWLREAAGKMYLLAAGLAGTEVRARLTAISTPPDGARDRRPPGDGRDDGPADGACDCGPRRPWR